MEAHDGWLHSCILSLAHRQAKKLGYQGSLKECIVEFKSLRKVRALRCVALRGRGCATYVKEGGC